MSRLLSLARKAATASKKNSHSHCTMAQHLKNNHRSSLVHRSPKTPNPTANWLMINQPPPNQPTSPKNNNQPSFTSNLPGSNNQHLPTSAIGHSLQGHFLMIFQSVLGFLNLLDEAGLIPWRPKLRGKLLGKLEEIVGFTKKLWMLDQWLCYAPNSFVMIVGNLIFGDPYSTLWPSTMLRWLNFMSLTRLREGRDCWPSAGFRCFEHFLHKP